MLTGRFDFRRSWSGKLVLRIEEEVRNGWPRSRKAPFRRRWRDASVMDLADPELRALLDLRRRPSILPSLDPAPDASGAEPPVRPASRPTEARIVAH